MSEDPRPGARRKLTAREETLGVAVACSSPPAGRARRTLELLADERVQRTGREGLSPETVRRRLTEQSVKRRQRKMKSRLPAGAGQAAVVEAERQAAAISRSASASGFENIASCEASRSTRGVGDAGHARFMSATITSQVEGMRI